MFFLPTPFLVSILFVAMAVLTYWHRHRSQQKQNFLFLSLIMIAAVQSFLLGWRWGYGIDTFQFLSPILAAIVPPLIYRLVLDLVGVNSIKNFRLWKHSIAPIAVAILLVAAPFAIDPFLIFVFVTYAFVILRLMPMGANSLQLASLEAAGVAYVSIMFAAFSLLVSALIDGVIFFEFLSVSGESAIGYITVANISLLMIITVAAFGIANYHTESGEMIDALPAAEDKPDATNEAEQAMLDDEEHEKTLALVEDLLVSKRLYRDVNLNLDRLARRLGVPARKVSNAINQIRGKNVSQFVNEFRVVEACDLLQKTDQSVTDIMFDVGFQTKSNFNREFRRVTGKTPLNWRNEKVPELDFYKNVPDGFFAEDALEAEPIGRLN